MKEKSDLEKYFRNNNSRLIHKLSHYFDIYERHFNRFRDKEIVVLEIGVSQGGSLQMWKHYFGDKAKIYGIDINPKCKLLEEKNIEVFIGSQSDRKFLKQVVKEIPEIDILIDDGGHGMKQQIVSFEELFNHVKVDGVYLCEDLCTSYWLNFGGGYKRRGTFIEYTKNFIDYLNAFHSRQKKLKVNSFTKTVDSIHYYDSVIVIEKRETTPPYLEKSGIESFKNEVKQTSVKKTRIKLQILILSTVNKILRYLKLPDFIGKRW